MNLIAVERYATHAAYHQGDTFTESDPFEMTEQDLFTWIEHKSRSEDRSIAFELENDAVIISFTNEIGLTTHQMIIESNKSDRNKLLTLLSDLSDA